MLRLGLSRCRVRCLSKQSARILGNTLLDCNQNESTRKYSTEWKYEAPERVQKVIDGNNIFRSPWGKVDLNEGLALHELIWKDADKWWNKTAMECSATGRSYTYGELRRLSGRLATSLRRLGVRPGSSVAVVLPNIPEFAVVAMGASEAGIPLTPMNPGYTAREIKFQLENSNAAAVVTVPSRYATVAESVAGVATMQHPVIVIEDGSGPAPAGSVKFSELVAESVAELEKTGEKVKIDVANDPVFLPYSSGTTGLPKGVELTHRNMVANSSQMHHRGITILEPAIGEFQDISAAILPFYHIYGLSMLLFSLRFGAKIVSVPSFTANCFLEIFERHQLTSLTLVPPLFQLLAYDPRFTKEHFKHLQSMTNGAASLNESLVDKLRGKFGDNFVLTIGYGLTESSPVVTSAINQKASTCGFVFPNTEMRIIGQSADNLGRNLGFDEVGEILVRGPQIMKGYFNNPAATAETMDGEWLRTGDLGFFNTDGLLSITGRLKELIKVNGMQVSPVELEEILRGHDKVADAAVVGVFHERTGETPKAFVVPKKDVSLHEDEIKSYIIERVVDYKRLGHVQFINQIPKSPIGKILRKELQKM